MKDSSAASVAKELFYEKMLSGVQDAPVNELDKMHIVDEVAFPVHNGRIEAIVPELEEELV